jgi:DNA ligase (NAD+)
MSEIEQRTSDRIRELADQILHHKQLYYDGRPEISDAAYDRLEDELKRLAPDHPVLSFVGSQKFSTGQKIEHDRPMLSLDKTYIENDLIAWADRHPVVGTVKIDGNSISLVYRGGALFQAKTRGNGRVGEDVMAKVRWVADIPSKLPNSRADVEIRGELYCTESQFLRLSHEMERQGLEKPTSPRNIVAGVLGRTTYVENARFFSFFSFDAIPTDRNLSFKTEIEKCDWLEAHCFRLPFHELLTSGDAIRSFLAKVQAMMNEDEIGIDGAVFSYNDLRLHDELGDTSHHPRYKLAFKWQGQTAVSTIREIMWDTSRLGIVTPVAIIDPVFLSGAKITNITLHNAAIVQNFALKPGDKIEVVRSGEVIPKFLRVVEADSGQVCLPKDCPSCGAKLEFDDVRLLCRNAANCPAQRSRSILNWLRCVEIDDISDKRLQQMIQLGLVETIPDLYRLTMDDMLKLPLTKEKMAQKILNNIQQSKNLPLARFLNGLGIEGSGLTTWEKLLEHFPNLDAIRKVTVDQVVAVEGFAEKSANQIVGGLKQKSKLIDQLLEAGVTPKSDGIVANSEGPLSGLTLVITGALSMPRGEFEKLIKRAGGKIASSVSKATSALVTNESDSSSSKMKKAKELGIPIWSEDHLRKKLEQPS